MLTSMIFPLLVVAAQQKKKRNKTINAIIQYKDIFDPSSRCINRCPFKWLFECGNELVHIQTYMLILPSEIP